MTLAFAVAFLTCVGVTLLVIREALRRRLLIDAPNARSSHAVAKPRGGGLGVVSGLAAGIVTVVLTGHIFENPGLVLLTCALTCAGIGLWDDVRGLPVGPRLAAEAALAAWLVYVTGPVAHSPLPPPLDLPLGVLGYVFPVVWLVGVTNFFNFMDGIDGLAAGQAAAVCLAVLASSWSTDSAVVAALLLASLLGFLRFNWWPSRIFLGDVGSLPVGFLLAGLPLLAPPVDRPRALLATAIGLTLFLLDPVQTLWRRFRRGAPIGQSHREHVYQQFLGPGDPHASVALALVGAGLVLSVVGLAVYKWPGLAWAGVLLAALAFGVEFYLGRVRVRS